MVELVAESVQLLAGVREGVEDCGQHEVGGNADVVYAQCGKILEFCVPRFRSLPEIIKQHQGEEEGPGEMGPDIRCLKC